LLKILVEDFMKKHQVRVTKDERAMAKFRMEANRLKAVLSVEDEAVSTVRNTPVAPLPDT